MNQRQHVAGFLLFSVILGSAIYINAWLNAPTATIPPIAVNEEVSSRVYSVELSEPDFKYNVRQVSIDSVNKQIYTQLVIKRQPGQLAPESLWVTTVFFKPGEGMAGKYLKTTREIREPFARGDQMQYTVSSQCAWCGSPGIANAGYFARVFVSTDPENLYPTDFDTDIRNATPVVVQVGR